MGFGQGPGCNHLIPLTFQGAFAAYEAVRHRLPPEGPGKAARRVADLDAIAERFDLFLLDAFGVLNIGETAIPGVPERVARLQAAGKRVMVLTNAASYPLHRLLAKYRGLGYAFDPQDVVSSRAALLAAMEADDGRCWGVMAPDLSDATDLSALTTIQLGDDPADYDRAEGFLLLGSGTWTGARQALLEASLTRNPRPVRVGNPDIVAPRETGLSVEPGHFAHWLADRTGVVPEFFGKPFGNIYDLAFARLGGELDRSRTVMVGDTLHTDVLGAQTAGVTSALVAGYGFFAGRRVDRAIATSGICPDFILDRP
ncbi:HAD hydrolase-like protein [Pukyongiella litopenaei]|uniref:HAD hydrolase-like protein n=1 Tax=Pukyongiella litopenaei TaxID=2605946 RepID=A0A2S0MNQ7_9RHOB|nr:HAD hydrolase-like protein [Pukyongiella litopenaei]